MVAVVEKSMKFKAGDEVEVRLAAKVVDTSGPDGAATVEIFLARPSRGNRYTTFVSQNDLHPVDENSIRQKIVEVIFPED